jgi:hypothetical protein
VARAAEVARRRRGDALGLAAVVALVVAAFGHLAVGRLLVRYDIVNYSLPYRVQVTEALRRLHLPEWDPFRFAGAPLLANAQAGVLYPPHWLLLGLKPDRAQDVSLVLHLALAGIGTFLFATRALRCSPAAGAVAGMAFAAGGFVHGNLALVEQVESLAWLPWVLLATDRTLAAGSLRRAARPMAGLAAALGLCALAGHTQYLYMAVAAAGLYALVVARPWVRAVWLLVAVVGGLLVAAAQLLPELQLADRSVRGGGLSLDAAGILSLPPARAMAALVPDYLGGSRLGTSPVMWAWLPWAVLAMAALAFATGRVSRQGAAVAGIAVVAAVLALGQDTPLFRVAHAVLPGFDRFRVPSRWLVLTSLAVALLGAVGLDAVASAARLRRRAAAVVGLVSAGALSMLVVGDGAPRSLSLILGLVAALTVIGSWWGTRWPAARRGLTAAMVAVVAVELLAAGAHTYAHWQRIDPGALTRRSATAEALGEGLDSRVLSIGAEGLFATQAQRRALQPNTHVLDGLRSPDGYDGGLLVSRRWITAMRKLTRHRAFNAELPLRGNIVGALDEDLFVELDVSHVVEHDWPRDVRGVLPEGSRRRGRAGDVNLWSTPRLGPVFLVDHSVPRGLRLERDPDTPERLVVDVPRDAGGERVVVSEAWAPGWSASGDVEVTDHRDFLISFLAPPDGGRVVLRYRTPGLALGAALSIAASVALVVAAMIGRHR